MKVDTLTKTLLAAIAIALWVNAANPWIHPRSALADIDSDIRNIRRDVSSIESFLDTIYHGTCVNSFLCR